jgi:hypothetical protein
VGRTGRKREKGQGWAAGLEGLGFANLFLFLFKPFKIKLLFSFKLETGMRERIKTSFKIFTLFVIKAKHIYIQEFICWKNLIIK